MSLPYDKHIGTKQKALRINLDRRIYGSFAEIGAGQDTAAHFFKAGGASGTIAKTMSAYDMKFSDEIYGPEPSGRYVVESRLMKMLQHEYDLVEQRLAEKRGTDSLFFAFANTV
ncbi:MAG: TonB-dependent receptor, partial [Runella sp.]